MKPYRKLISLIIFLSVAAAGNAASEIDPSRIVKDVGADGSCAIVGMIAEQCQLLALQRARDAAIKEAAGIKVTGQTLITDGKLSVDFIRTYSTGYIIREEVEWLPIGQYQRDKETPPIPEYRVKIVADVYRPEKKIKPIGLSAKLNNSTFRSGEKAMVEIKVEKKSEIAIFNIMADDSIVMLFPNKYESDTLISEGGSISFPSKDSPINLTVGTLPGHKRDAEAIFVSAMDITSGTRFGSVFTPEKPMTLEEFFRKYSEISDWCEDKILAYEVVSE